MTIQTIKVRRGKRPWGYSQDPDNPGRLLPDTRALELLQQAFAFLDRDHPFRSVAEWLSAQSGVPIGLATLFRLYRQRLSELPRLARKT